MRSEANKMAVRPNRFFKIQIVKIGEIILLVRLQMNL